jgi:predicted permease
MQTLLSLVFAEAWYALRNLARRPLFGLLTTGSLGLGIACATTAFGVVDALFLRLPPGLRDPGSLRQVVVRNASGDFPGGATSYPVLQALRRAMTGTIDVAVFGSGSATLGTRTLQATLVSDNFFTVLGVSPAEGRFFVPSEDQVVGLERVCVLSYDVWHGALHGDRAVLSGTVTLNGLAYRVVGIAPPRFGGLDGDRVDVWLPVSLAADHTIWPSPLSDAAAWLHGVGRLGPTHHDASQAASVATRALSTILGRATSSVGAPQPFVELKPLGPPMVADWGGRASVLSDVRYLAQALSLVAALVFGLVCANVGTLLMLRANGRRQEIALRVALGARRAAIVRLVVNEALWLALGGVGIGLLLTIWTRGVLRVVPGASRQTIYMSGRLVAFASLAGVCACLLSSLAPVLRAVAIPAMPTIKLVATAGRRESLVRESLVAAQIALGFTLVTTSSLFLRTMQRLNAVDLGMDVTHVAVVQPRSEAGVTSARTLAGLRQVLAGVPGVTGVAFAAFVPFSSSLTMVAHAADGPRRRVRADFVDSSYFRVLGIRVTRGRPFGTTDQVARAPVAIINETLAHEWWPGRDPLGQCLYLAADGACQRVVAVVADAKYGSLDEAPAAVVYRPFREDGPFWNGFVRTRGPAVDLVPVLRATVAGSNLSDGVEAYSLDATTSRAVATAAGRAFVFLFVGVCALGIAAVGVLGVTTYGIAQRTREFGIRVALGAGPRRIAALVLNGVARTTLAGVVVGIVVALWVTSTIGGLLFGISSTDAVSYGVAVVVVTGAATIAGSIPAYVASRLSPAAVLRDE